jgi:cbb3-type cytochrome oxidase subunit 1
MQSASHIAFLYIFNAAHQLHFMTLPHLLTSINTIIRLQLLMQLAHMPAGSMACLRFYPVKEIVDVLWC